MESQEMSMKGLTRGKAGSLEEGTEEGGKQDREWLVVIRV